MRDVHTENQETTRDSADPGTFTFITPGRVGPAPPWEENRSVRPRDIKSPASRTRASSIGGFGSHQYEVANNKLKCVSIKHDAVTSGGESSRAGYKPEAVVKDSRLLHRRSTMPAHKFNSAKENLKNVHGHSTAPNGWDKLRSSRIKIFGLGLYTKLFKKNVFGQRKSSDEKDMQRDAEVWLETPAAEDEEKQAGDETLLPGLSDEGKYVIRSCYQEKVHNDLTELFPEHKQRMMKRSKTPQNPAPEFSPRIRDDGIVGFHRVLDALKVRKGEEVTHEVRGEASPRQLIGRYNFWIQKYIRCY